VKEGNGHEKVSAVTAVVVAALAVVALAIPGAAAAPPVAAPNSSPCYGIDSSPAHPGWPSWTFWQYGQSGIDADKFNGNGSQLLSVAH
jgi:uncharacterized membrane protein